MATSQLRNHPSSSSEFKSSYDIFLSFRGLDTRKKFTDHLYYALKHEGFQVFRDDDEIERGERIKSELLKAIRNSRMSVIVLSKNYADSTACLSEAQMILERHKESNHFVFPVFYEVEPWVLKEQSKKLVFEKKEVAAEKAKGWSAALNELASMAGMVSQNQSDGYEAKFIKEIVGKLTSKLARKHLRLDDHLVGMDSQIEHIDEWLSYGPTGVGVLVISGMGGIGKTTIAKVLYNLHYGNFDAACFLPNIREVAKEPNGLVGLQRQLLANILRKEEHKVNDVDDGCRRLKYVLANKRVLLVLDDVDQMDHLSALVGQQEYLMPGSKIIITTRLESVMNAYDTCKVFRPRKLNSEESFELFSWHAFRQKHPIQDHVDLSKRFVHHCDGLPLALQVLGSSLRLKSLGVWESALRKLGAVCDATILEKLEISYDSLKDDHDKNLFLEIACFFAGKKINEAITILEGCDYFALAGIDNLMDRNLITIENNKLEMHQLLQDMGRQIVCRESKYPQERSRIWRHKESFNILLEKIGTEKIEGLILDLRNSKMEVFEANTFEKIYNLRLLKLNGVQLSGTYQAFPKRLRWLYWRGFPSEYLPSDIPLENLVSLDLRYSKLKQFWKGTKVLRSLKILNLSHSPELVKTPDFSRIPNLEKLILKACPSLFEIDESIVELQRIELLNLQDCENLRKLPRNINMVESLVEINISGCSNLMGAMEELEKMKSIRVFCASRMDIDHLLTREVVPQGSSPPRMLMSLTSLPSSLTHLNLSHCNLTENAFPGDFSTLSKLQQLFLDGNPISSLPKAIKDLTGLQTLDLSWCPKLQQILWPSIGLEKLVVTQCHALEKITAENRRVSRPYPVKIVSHGGCINLNYVQWSFKILPVREIDVELLNCIGFFNLDSMADVDAVIVNSIVWSRKKLPIQVLYETPLFTTVYLERKVPMFATFYPERKVPHWFSNKNRGSTVSFTATLSPHFRFRGLNLCMVYTLPAEPERLACPIHFEIINKSSGSKTDYKPRYYGHPEEGGDLVWLSYCFQENLFRDGDEVEVSFGITSDGEIKECGVHLLYLEDEGQVSQYNSTLHHSWDSIVFPYVPCAEEMAQLPNDSSEAIIPHAEEAIPLSSVPSGNTRKRKAKAITDIESKTRKKSLRAISSGPSQKTSESSSISEKPKRNAITTKTPTPTKQSKRTQTKKLAGSSGEKPITKKSKRTKIVDAFEETEEGNSSQSSQIRKSSFSLGETNTEQAIDQFEFGDTAVSDPLLQDDGTPVMQENPLFRENPLLLQDDNSLMQVNEGHSSSHSTLPAAPSVLLSFSGTSPSKSATSPSAIVTCEGHVSLKNSWPAAPSNLLPSSTLQVQSPGEVSFADLMDPIELEGLIARIEKPPIQSTPLSSNEAAVHIQRGLLISLQSSTISIDDIITRTNGIISVLKTFNVDLSPLYEKVKALVKYSALWAKVAGTSDRDVSLGELEAQCEEKKAKFEGLTSSYDEILASASKLTERVSSLEEEITRMKEVLKNLESELSSCKVNQSSSLSDLVKFSENISKSERDFNAAMDAVEQRKKKSVLFDTVKEALDDARASLVALSSL